MLCFVPMLLVDSLELGEKPMCCALVYLTRHVSGGQLNPSITLAVTASGHMHWFRGFLYIIAQVGSGGSELQSGPFCVVGVEEIMRVS